MLIVHKLCVLMVLLAGTRRRSRGCLRCRVLEEHVFLQPFEKSFAGSRDLIPAFIECVVSVIVPHGVRWRGAARSFHYRIESPKRQDRSVRSRPQIFHYFLYCYHYPPGTESCFFLNADYAPHQNVAALIGSLGMDDRHVGSDSRYCRQTFPGERTLNETNVLIVGRQICSGI